MDRRRTALLALTLLFVLETRLLGAVQIAPFEWVMLAAAASFGGRAVAYLAVLDWLRWPFVTLKPHSSGAGEDYHPRWSDGARAALAELVCCPVCAGAWSAMILLMVYKLDGVWGHTLMVVLSAASGAWLISYVTQWAEWQTHAARETTGLLNRHSQEARKLYDSNGHTAPDPQVVVARCPEV